MCIGGYVVQRHVPVRAINKLLSERSHIKRISLRHYRRVRPASRGIGPGCSPYEKSDGPRRPWEAKRRYHSNLTSPWVDCGGGNEDKGAGDATRMAVCRTILAFLIALAVCVAPVSAALAAAHASPKAAMQDCHGKAPVHCPHCDKDKLVNKNKCPGDGSKCCKLVGALSSAQKVTRPLTEPQQLPEPRRLTGWRRQPQPPPPRS